MTPEIDERTLRLFAQVGEAIARSTWALLHGEAHLAKEVVEADAAIDREADEIAKLVWQELDAAPPASDRLRCAFAVLMVVRELERSADLAEHVAKRGLSSVGAQMTPAARGIVQRMSEVAGELWRTAADAYAEGEDCSRSIHDADEELDILHERLTSEVAAGSMSHPVAQEVTLVARFYERLGDHAVNIGRRMADIPVAKGA